MIITNKHNLPDIIVSALKNDPYDRGDCDISVTQLIAPPQVRRLQIEYDDVIEQDVADMVYALEGSALHHILERGNDSSGRYIVEERYFDDFEHPTKLQLNVNAPTKIRLSGQIDLYDNKTSTLYDYKKAPKSVLNYPPKPEWEQQLNILNYLSTANGNEPAKRLVICVLLRDYSKMRDTTPPIVEIEIPLWSMMEARDYIEMRLALHFADETPECTDADRWNKGSKFAVMKKGRKTAVSVFDDRKHANTLIGYSPIAGELYIEERPGQNIRCEFYCSAAPFCPQFKKIKEGVNDGLSD